MSVNKSIAQILAASAITFLAAHTFAGANAMMAGTTQLSLTKTISNYASASDADSVFGFSCHCWSKRRCAGDHQGAILSVSRG